MSIKDKNGERQHGAEAVAESPVADVFAAGRRPSEAEEKWAEGTLLKTLERSPERPIGAATGTNLDEQGEARFSTISNVPVRRSTTLTFIEWIRSASL